MNRLDGKRSIEEIAEDLSIAWKTPVRPSDIRTLVDHLLLRHDLLIRESSPEPSSDSPSGSSASTRGILLIPARFLSPLTLHLRRLFHPALVIPLLLASAFLHFSFYDSLFSRQPADSFHTITPGTYLAGYLALFCTVLFHELGHLSASRYFHCPHGEIRFGLYLIFPVFYANVTPSWRLERKARLVVDLGGVYFQLILLFPCFTLFQATQDPLWLILILELDSMIGFALNPFLRFDGYWICSDLLGVPNLRSRSFGILRDMTNRIIRRPRTTPSPFLDIRLPEKVGLVAYALGSLFFFLGVFLVLLRFLPSQLLQLPPRIQKILALIVHEGLQDHAWDLLTILFRLVLVILLLMALRRMAGMVLRTLFAFAGRDQKGEREANRRNHQNET